MPRPGRFPPDHPDERRARARLMEGKKKLPGKKVVKIKSRGKFSYNGKGR